MLVTVKQLTLEKYETYHISHFIGKKAGTFSSSKAGRNPWKYCMIPMQFCIIAQDYTYNVA